MLITSTQEKDIVKNNLTENIQPFIRYKRGTYPKRLIMLKQKYQGTNPLIRMKELKTPLYLY